MAWFREGVAYGTRRPRRQLEFCDCRESTLEKRRPQRVSCVRCRGAKGRTGTIFNVVITAVVSICRCVGKCLALAALPATDFSSGQATVGQMK